MAVAAPIQDRRGADAEGETWSADGCADRALARSRTNHVQSRGSALCFGHEVENARSRQPPPDPRARSERSAAWPLQKWRNFQAGRRWFVIARSPKDEAPIQGNRSRGTRASDVPLERQAAKAGRRTGVVRHPSPACDDGAGSDSFRSHTRLERCDRPENPAQALGNIESAPGISTGRSPKLSGARPGRRRSPRLQRRLGRCDRPENRPQGLGNTESAPGISPRRPPKLSCPRPGWWGSPRPQCRLRCCDRPENLPQGFENMESAPGISTDRSRKLSGPRPGRPGSPPCAKADPFGPGPSPRTCPADHDEVLVEAPRPVRCDRPENRPQALGNIESAPGNVGSSSRGVRRTTRAMQRNPGAGALPDRHAAEARRETRAFGRLTGLAMLAWALGGPGPNAGLGVAIARKIGRKVLKTWNPRPGIFGPSSRGDGRATPVMRMSNAGAVPTRRAS